MCDKCPAGTGYATAYRNAESVSVEVRAFCPGCQAPAKLEVKSHIHFGGEFWEPYLSCDRCKWGIVLSVYISDVNRAKVQSSGRK